MNIEKDITNCITTLKSGGIILYPTDTIWGIGCDATNEEAVAKIYALKNRSNKKSMIILLADVKELHNYIDNLNEQIFEYLSTVTKPTTIIYSHAKGLAKNCINEDGSIAIRIVQDEFCQQLIRQFGKPIVSTSANIATEKSPINFLEIDAKIKNGVDYIVQHRQNDLSSSTPSSIIKWNNDGNITIIR
jgi:L-threonylcarbamoyladenylate synthase